jgi:N-hydroxyarylamine O-acetyltransferase
MNLQAYFDRIGYTEAGTENVSKIKTDTERLFRVHKRHMLAIPFENLDVYNNKTVSVTPEAVFDKLVINKRGGYCFEMNCLLAAALKEMGFKVYGVLARGAMGPGGFGPHLHRMNIAEADGKRYVCDVGFGGDCFIEPLLFQPGLEQRVHGCTYRIVKSESVMYSVQILKDGLYTDMLGFDDIPALESDFGVSNFYTNFHPESGFRHFVMINLFTENGRYSMFNEQLTVRDGEETTRTLLSGEELPAALENYFGIKEPVEIKTVN